jgi:proline dehydrogenase
MLKEILIYLSKSERLQKMFSNWKIARRVSSRFVAGENRQEAIQIVRKLNQDGFLVTLAHLGEHTSSFEAAKIAGEEIVLLVQEIQNEKIQANVSIKLTQLGLLIDTELLESNLQKILLKARDTDNFIRIDMEDSSITGRTLEILNWCRSSYSGVGIVLQSYLFRTEIDIVSLLDQCVPIRLVKGAYLESNLVAFTKMEDVDKNFDRITNLILDKSISCDQNKISESFIFPPLLAVASHDEKRIVSVIENAKLRNIPNKLVELQMLYGIRRDLQEKYRKMGYPVRIYVPYGTHWYPYFMRRLAERPANVWFLVKNIFKT